jgi:uncharacterized protein
VSGTKPPLRRSHVRWPTIVAVLFASSVGASAAATSIVDVVKSADRAALRTLLQRKPDVNAPEVDGTTALHWAAYQGDLETTDLLLRAGANPRIVNRYGVTALSLAVERGVATVVERLLRAGADANAVLPGGETVLMTAARAGHADVVKLLLSKGASPNAREATRGQTALMWAATEGHAAVIRTLVEAGAEIDARSHGPTTAPSYENYSPVSVYRNYARRGRIDAFTPLLFAARAGRIEAIDALIGLGANPNDSAEDGTSALMLAIINMQWEAAAMLLEKGADPNNTALGWTPLHQVARSRSLPPAEFPRPMPAGRISSLELAQKLIARGADVNARMKANDFDDDYSGGFRQRAGATPLLEAAKGVDHGLMRLLLSSGADPRATNVQKTNVLMLASGVELAQIGVDSGTTEDAVEAVKIALELGLDVNATDENGETALHGAAYRASTEVAQLLIDRGARLDAVNKKGKGCTPIQIANYERAFGCGRGSAPELRELLRRLMTERGLPTNLRTAEEKSDFIQSQ